VQAFYVELIILIKNKSEIHRMKIHAFSIYQVWNILSLILHFVFPRR